MKLYHVTFTHKDGSTEVHEHQSETDLIKLGACDWSNIKSVSIELEPGDPDEEVAVIFPRHTWAMLARVLREDVDYYEQSDAIEKQIR